MACAVTKRHSIMHFVADTHFVGDLCVALAAPLVMLGSTARSLDPRVAGGQGQGQAVGAADQPPGPACAETSTWVARHDFPFGANAAVQVDNSSYHKCTSSLSVVYLSLIQLRRGANRADRSTGTKPSCAVPYAYDLVMLYRCCTWLATWCGTLWPGPRAMVTGRGYCKTP